MIRIDVVYAGLAGMPAYNFFYYRGNSQAVADAGAENVGAFLLGLEPFMSDNVTYDISNVATQINPENGDQTAFYAVTGTSGAGDATVDPLPVGTSANLRFRTAGVVNNRRVTGRVFLPGWDEGTNGPNGVITPTILPVIDTLAQDTLSSPEGDHVVWSRPVEGGRIGSEHTVTTYTLSDVFSNLRTRRR